MFYEPVFRPRELPEHPERIVSLSPAITETVFMLGGQGSRLVGVSAFCQRPEEAKRVRRVGSYSHARPEVLREVRPDLILAVSGYQARSMEEVSREFTTFTLELPSSVPGILDMVKRVGAVLGCPVQAMDLMCRLEGSMPDPYDGERIPAYVEIDLGGPVSFGIGSYITDALHLCGFESVYGRRDSEWLKPDDAETAAIDPEVIIYEPKMFSNFKREEFEAEMRRRGLAQTRAFRKGNVFITPGKLDFLAHHGPSFITDAIPWLLGIRKRIEGLDGI